jgi:acyl-[acyl-carrier-protein]-phospholipid O-acyltransferase/long-chain-fatty-acid--[acyl-carrier-protein] ligase
MVPLGAIEALASTLWPGVPVGAIAQPDKAGNEKVVLAVEHAGATREALVAFGKEQGVGAILLPARVVQVERMPLLASGKIDYPALMRTL